MREWTRTSSFGTSRREGHDSSESYARAGKEKTGYATQKPEGVLKRMLTASSKRGEWVLDFFAGSGTLGAVASQLGRRYVLCDSNLAAIDVMKNRLGSSTDLLGSDVKFVEFGDAK